MFNSGNILFTRYLWYILISDYDETEAVHNVLVLTSDFTTLDVNTLDKQEPDDQMFEFFSLWSKLNRIIDGKNTKIRSYSVDYAYIYYKSVNKTIEGK